MSKTSSTQVFEQQVKRHEALKKRHNEALVAVQAARTSLAQAQAEAKAEFGTDNLEELRELYSKLDRDNDQAVVDFVMALDEVESQVQDVERLLKQA